MATITYDDGAVFTVGTGYTTNVTGSGKKVPALGVAAGGPVKVASGILAFDASYPTGGEDIANIYAQFKSCTVVMFEQPILAGAQTGKFVRANHSTQKAQLFTNASPYAEVANASDQSATAVRFIAIGT